MANLYLDNVYKGKNEGWRYLLSFGAIGFAIISSSIISIVIIVLNLVLKGERALEKLITFSETANMNDIGLGYVGSYIVNFIPFYFILFTLILCIKYIHKQKLLDIITSRTKFDFKSFLWGFFLWIIFIGILSTLIEMFIFPTAFEPVFNIKTWLNAFILFIIFVPVQVLTEELFFRGYLLQLLNLKIKNIHFIALISSIFFLVSHFPNSESSYGWLFMTNYLIIGLFLSYSTIKNEGIEFASGIHLANNFIASLLISYTNSTVITPSILFNSQVNVVYSIVSIIVCSLITYFIYFSFIKIKKVKIS